MTAIAGFCGDGIVWIGGDSAGVGGYSLTIRKDPKVFQKGGFLFGYTSSFRMGQLLRFSFDPPPHPEGLDEFAYMVGPFIEALRECFKKGGYAVKDKEQESAGTFLAGYRGRLFKIDNDYQVGEPLDSYDACGSGEDVIRGAFCALAGLKGTPFWLGGAGATHAALEAAQHHNTNVREPFVIVSMGEEWLAP